MSVRQAQAEIDSAEYAEWRAYLTQIEPHGSLRGDVHAAMISANIINALGGKVAASDLLPDFDAAPVEPETKIDAEAIKAEFEMLRLMEQQKRKAQSPR